MPPHSVYVEAFAGSATVFFHKRAAARSILIDAHLPVIEALRNAGSGIVEEGELQLIHGDAIAHLQRLALPADAVVYADPPYLLQTRQGRRYYDNELSDEQHRQLLAVLGALRCRVLLSGYPSELYGAALRGWRCQAYRTRTHGKTVTECLWANFPEPEQLHDWRFAGGTFREREALKRLASRWKARLERMPARKRGYLVASLFGAMVDGNGKTEAAPLASSSEEALDTPKGTPLRHQARTESPASCDASRVTEPGHATGGASRLVLSLFPGADLLGRGFEAEGFCVVRGPDLVWGSKVEEFRPVPGAFAGVIGGPPCQDFSQARRTPPTGNGEAMMAQFSRILSDAQPEWWLCENVPGVPDVNVPGYQVQRFNLSASECGCRQRRLRRFQFGFRDGPGLCITRAATPPGIQPAAMATEGLRKQRRTFADFCELQGLPRDFDLPGLSIAAKYRAVGNGVPVPMARVVAAAILRRRDTAGVRLCICDCGRPVTGKATLATAACRKRMQRRRDSAGGANEGPDT
jgi:DNA (cytosine-5)-methyltransferase 1